MTVKELLTKARCLITDPDDWGTGTLESHDGLRCAVGALYAADGATGRVFIDNGILPDAWADEELLEELLTTPEQKAEFELLRQAHAKLATAARQHTQFPFTEASVVWNLNDSKGHEAVLSAYDDAIAAAE